MILLLACNQGTDKPTVDEHKGHDHATMETEGKHEDEIQGALALNNGAKWKSDENTKRNVSELRAIASGFKEKNDPQTGDYRQAGDRLSEGLNIMIKECKMRGVDHDALHLWLDPLLKEVNQLQKVGETSSGKDIFNSVDTRLNVYENYFELL